MLLKVCIYIGIERWNILDLIILIVMLILLRLLSSLFIRGELKLIFEVR